MRFGDPAWLARLRRGIDVKLWNIAVSVFVFWISGLVTGAFGLSPLLMGAVGFFGSVLGLMASFLITRPEPGLERSDDPQVLRRAIRYCSMIALGGSGMNLAAVDTTLGVVGQGLTLLGFVAFVGEMVYLRHLALRVPDHSLARSTKIVAWGFSASVVLFALSYAGFWYVWLASLAARRQGAAAPFRFNVDGLIPVMIVCGIAALASFFWYLRLLFRYRQLFAAALTHARVAGAEPSAGDATHLA